MECAGGYRGSHFKHRYCCVLFDVCCTLWCIKCILVMKQTYPKCVYSLKISKKQFSRIEVWNTVFRRYDEPQKHEELYRLSVREVKCLLSFSVFTTVLSISLYFGD